MVRRRGAAVAIGYQFDPRGAQPRIPFGAGFHAAPCAKQVCPRREQDSAGGHLHPLVAQRQQQRQRQPATGRLAADNDLLWRVTLCQQESVGGAGVQQPGGELVLRRKAVFGQQCSSLTGAGDMGDKAAMGLAGADEIAAAVQIKKRPV